MSGVEINRYEYYLVNFALLFSAEMRHVVVVFLLASFGAGSEDFPYCRENTTCSKTNDTTRDGLLSYKVDEIQVNTKYQATKSFEMECFSQSISVDNGNLPVMSQLQHVEEVQISNCSPPLNASYADALKAMNFTVTKSLTLIDPCAGPRLDHQHFAGLPIHKLKIHCENPLQPTPNYLDGLLKLRELELYNVILEPEALMRLPKALEILNLQLAQLPAAKSELGNESAWLERLSSMRELYMNDPNTNETLNLPKLESLSNLTILKLDYVPLDTDSLAGKLKGSSIKHLEMRSCGLKNLPKRMFEGANYLTDLNLSLNNLTVDEGVFSPLQWLTKLDVKESQVDSADLVNIVSSLPRLETLEAGLNPLGSLCGDADISSNLMWPKSLRKLNLSKTNVTRICPNWIDNDALLDVNLSDNDIRYLNYNYLKMKGDVLEPTAAVAIDLTNNPSLRIINVSSADIVQCRKDFIFSSDSNHRMRTKVIVKLSNLLSDTQCDYDAYLLHEVVRDCPWLQFNIDIFTNIRYNYTHSKPMEILCPFSGSCVPGTQCSCKKRPRDNATVVQCQGALPQTPRWLLTALEYPVALHVEPGTLDRVPDASVLIELHAPHNNITQLNEEDLPDTLLELDIRSNKIEYISKEVAQQLNKIETNRSVFLEGNRLACNCSDAPALELLKNVVRDLNKTQCEDKIEVLLKMQSLSDQCAFPVFPLVFGLLSIVLVLFMVWLLVHKFKPQIRQLLFKLNWGRRFIFGVKDDDAEKTVDVFLSYAYPDLEVLTELKNGLEARGYSTLEHNHDWHPGVPIIDQIVVSVKCARRTLLLVSDNYADSKWAVKEFHTAHAHAMKRQTARVLVVRYNLQQPERLPSDLQLYLKYNTYLDRNDVHFWKKMSMAMPRIRSQINN